MARRKAREPAANPDERGRERADYIGYNDRVNFLRGLYFALRAPTKPKGVTYQKLSSASHAGLSDSGWTNLFKYARSDSATDDGISKHFSDEQYTALVHFCKQERIFERDRSIESLRELDGYLGIAMAAFLNIGNQSSSQVAERAPGTYRVFHRSQLVPSKYVCGVAVFAEPDPLKTITVHQYYEQPAGTDDLSLGRIAEEHIGSLVRKNGRYLIISNDTMHQDFRITVLPQFRMQNQKLYLATGVMLGFNQSSLLSVLPVMFERYSDATDWPLGPSGSELRAQYGIHSEENVDEVVVAQLEAQRQLIKVQLGLN
ncbi:MAG: hypothetical protein AAF493_07910 [Pseudomonadota bacterium]